MLLSSCKRSGNYLIAQSLLGITPVNEETRKIITTIMILVNETTRAISLIRIRRKTIAILAIITTIIVATTTVACMKNHRYHSSNS